MKFGKFCLVLVCAAVSPGIYATTYFNNTGTASCNSADGAVGTFSCGAGAAQTNTDAAINGFGFFINPTFQQFASSVNGAAPLGSIVDGSHDPASSPIDTRSGCNTGAVAQHCETLTFSITGTTAAPITAGSTILFNWNNINLTLADFSGPNGSYLDQYYVEYIIKNSGGTTILDWNSDPSNTLQWAQTGSGTGSGPTSEANLAGSGSTVLGTGLNGNYTVQAILHVGWLWLGPQTGTPAAAGSQGPGIDLDISIGSGSLDLGVVPEPSTIGIAGLGLALAGVGVLRKRRAVNAR
jgi:hypothetical protein